MDSNFQDFIASHSDEELLRMMYRRKDDQEDMRRAAEEELKRREKLPEDFIARRNELIAAEDSLLSEGKEASVPQQIFGWLGIFGLLGIIIGYDLYFSKKESRYTAKLYAEYNDMSRESGRYMFYISLVTHALFILWKLGPFIENHFNIFLL